MLANQTAIFFNRVRQLLFGVKRQNVLWLLSSRDCIARHGRTIGLCALPNGQLPESVASEEMRSIESLHLNDLDLLRPSRLSSPSSRGAEDPSGCTNHTGE